MKILLDECVSKHLKTRFNAHHVFTVREMQWGGVKNGKLMSLCVENGFDIFLTIDKNLTYQQNLIKYPLIVVVLNSSTSKVDELATFLPILLKQLPGMEKHKAYLIDK